MASRPVSPRSGSRGCRSGRTGGPPTRTDRAGRVRRAGVQGGERQVRRAPELHPRDRRQAPAQPQRREPAERPDTPGRAPAGSPGEEHLAGSRGRRRATSSRIAKVEGLEIGDTIAYANHAPKLPRRRSRRRCSGWPSSRRTAATSRRSRPGLHKIADEDPTVKVTHDAADARTGHHRRQPAAPGRDPASGSRTASAWR